MLASAVRTEGNVITTKGLVITALAALVLIGMTLWLMFPMTNAAKLSSNPLFPFVLIFALLPLYPLYRLAKRWPRFSSGIIALGTCLLVTLAAGLSYYVFHIDNPWVEHLFDLSQILCAIGGFLLVWQAARRKHS